MSGGGPAIRVQQIPSADEKKALAGTAGVPSNTNRFVTDEDTRLAGGVGEKGDTGVTGLKGDTGVGGGGGGATALDDLTDVATAGQTKNQVLKFNGTEWVPAAFDYSFAFSISSFADDQSGTQLIGSGVWRTTGLINFVMSYLNGPPNTSCYIALSSDGGVTWGSDLTVITPFTSAASVEGTNYPSTKDRYISFTLNATEGESDSATRTVTFRNNIKYGVSTETSWDSSSVSALIGTLLSNAHTGSFAINSGAGQYLIFAHPSSYTSIHATGFLFNSVACPFQSEVLVSVTNGAGFTENYKVYRSTLSNLGNSTLVASTSSNIINRIYWGVTSKASTFLESDVEGLANSAVSNTKGRTFTVTGSATEYILYALPARLGAVVFWVGGFEGGFMPYETVSATNINGYVENYNVYRAANFANGSITVMVV